MPKCLISWIYLMALWMHRERTGGAELWYELEIVEEVVVYSTAFWEWIPTAVTYCDSVSNKVLVTVPHLYNVSVHCLHQPSGCCLVRGGDDVLGGWEDWLSCLWDRLKYCNKTNYMSYFNGQDRMILVCESVKTSDNNIPTICACMLRHFEPKA